MSLLQNKLSTEQIAAIQQTTQREIKIAQSLLTMPGLYFIGTDLVAKSVATHWTNFAKKTAINSVYELDEYVYKFVEYLRTKAGYEDLSDTSAIANYVADKTLITCAKNNNLFSQEAKSEAEKIIAVRQFIDTWAGIHGRATKTFKKELATGEFNLEQLSEKAVLDAFAELGELLKRSSIGLLGWRK